MPAQSCWERIFHPFSAVIKFQKEFASDVLTNVRKQREVLNRHHREMALREQELHLDELEEKYKCCVCGAKGESRDFEPPTVLVNAISEGVTQAAAVVAQHSAKMKPARAGKTSVRLVIPGEGTVTPGETPPLTPSITSVLSPREALSGPLSESADTLPPPASQGEGNSRNSALATPVAAAPGPVTPREVRELIERAKREIVSAQKLKRLEERHKKLGSYHRDKGLMRIHETDIEAFSQFFQKPVRGFLCLECHSGARKRLDVLTQEIQQILTRAQKPFVTEVDRHVPSSAARPSPTSSSAPALPVDAAQQPTGPMARLCAEDILALRQLAQCGVCMRRHPTYFLRKNVLFLCQFCCAIDRFYRHHAVCINNELMPLDHVVLLEQLAKQYRGDDASLRQSSKAFMEARVRDFAPQRNLFSQQQNLFLVQDLALSNSDLPPEVVVDRLIVRPDFSKIVQGANADKQTLSRELARSTVTSLFHGKELAPSVNLFDEISHLRAGCGGGEDQNQGPRFDDLVNASGSGQLAREVDLVNPFDEEDRRNRPEDDLGSWNPFGDRDQRSLVPTTSASLALSSSPSIAPQVQVDSTYAKESAAPVAVLSDRHRSDDEKPHARGGAGDSGTCTVIFDDGQSANDGTPSMGGSSPEALTHDLGEDHPAACDPLLRGASGAAGSSEPMEMEPAVQVARHDTPERSAATSEVMHAACRTAEALAADESPPGAARHGMSEQRQEVPPVTNDTTGGHTSEGEAPLDGSVVVRDGGLPAVVHANEEGATETVTGDDAMITPGRRDAANLSSISSPFSGFGFPSPGEPRAPPAGSSTERQPDEYNFASSPLRTSLTGVAPAVTPGGFSDFSSFGFPSPPAQTYDFAGDDDLR